jgi:hypothetical protein
MAPPRHRRKALRAPRAESVRLQFRRPRASHGLHHGRPRVGTSGIKGIIEPNDPSPGGTRLRGFFVWEMGGIRSQESGVRASNNEHCRAFAKRQGPQGRVFPHPNRSTQCLTIVSPLWAGGAQVTDHRAFREQHRKPRREKLPVAHWVEHRSFKPEVAGSTPAWNAPEEAKAFWKVPETDHSAQNRARAGKGLVPLPRPAAGQEAASERPAGRGEREAGCGRYATAPGGPANRGNVRSGFVAGPRPARNPRPGQSCAAGAESASSLAGRRHPIRPT